MRECGGCRFCCWSYNVQDVPDQIRGITTKVALSHCQYECSAGCSIHDKPGYPSECKSMICPYLSGKDIHRPDSFQTILEQSKSNIGNYIPSIPPSIPIEEAELLIQKTRSIPAYITVGNDWIRVILPLDKDETGRWSSDESAVKEWKELYKAYGEKLQNKYAFETWNKKIIAGL